MKAAIISLVLGVIAIGTTVNTQPKGELYPTCGVITEINGDTVTFEEPNGNMWSFEGAEDWCEGDIIAAMMDDNGTEQIYDDQIISVRYKGF